MNLRLKKVLASLLWGLAVIPVFSANVDWNKAFVVYEGLDYSGVYEQYTMGSPFLNMKALRNGNALEIWAHSLYALLVVLCATDFFAYAIEYLLISKTAVF